LEQAARDAHCTVWSRSREDTLARHRDKTAFVEIASVAVLGLLAAPMLATAQTAMSETPLSQFGRDLLNDGIFFRGRYIGEFAANPIGGIKQSQRYDGQLILPTDFDLNKITGIGGAALHVTVTQRHGQSLSAMDIGNSVGVQSGVGGGQTYRLTELSWDQALFDDHLEFSVGRLILFNDFASSSFFCEFQTNAVCGKPSVFGLDNALTFFPVSTWGSRFSINPTRNTYVQAGAYELDPSQSQRNHHGFDFGAKRSTGVVVPFELGYQTTFRSDAMPRHYLIGGFHDDSDFADPFFDRAGGSAALSGLAHETRNGRTSLYAVFDQMVWRPNPNAEHGLFLFGAAAVATSSAQTANYFLELGVVDRGPFAGRENDTIGFVVTDLRFGSRTLDAIVDARRAAGGSGRPPSNEVMMELNYGAQVTTWLRLVPNVQGIVNPDQINEPRRKTNIPNAFVVGCKFVIGLSELFGISNKRYTH
jgi:porin